MTIQEINQVRGRIFDIQRYSIHDGPGIRTIVFLKGCFLRCRWCCNPESQDYRIVEMTMNGKTRTVGEDISVGEVMETVLRDMNYYLRSGGGLTLSGGECLFQPEFASALLASARYSGLNTAIETTAFAPFERIEMLLPHLNTMLLDIKHMDSVKHKAFTGVPNELILENARKVALSGTCNLVVRVPVIPTFNDTPEEIAAIASFANKLTGVKRMHLLPYHRLGQDKYAGMGRDYSLPNLLPPSNEHMQELLQAAQDASSLYVQIGG